MTSQVSCQANKYKYTKDGMYLTNQQRDFFEENGFLVIRNLVDTKLLDECKERFANICSKKVYPIGPRPIKDVHLEKLIIEGESVINSIENIYYDDVFFKYVTYQPILDVVQSVIGPYITCCQSFLINRAPNSEIDTPKRLLHQDLFFFPFRPSNSLVACTTAMETVCGQNEFFFVVPKTHKIGFLPHNRPPNANGNALYALLDRDNYSSVNVLLEKGDAVFYHPLLLHGSRPNFTSTFRKTLSCHYVDSNSFYFIDKDNTEKVNEMDIVERSGFGRAGFQRYWKNKCCLVRGPPGKVQNLDGKL